jgi:hypothetical protein
VRTGLLLVFAILSAPELPGVATATAQSCNAPVSRAPVEATTLDPERLVGTYTLTAVSTWLAKKDTIAAGDLVLWLDTTPLPPNRPPETSGKAPISGPTYARPSLVGTTNAPLGLLSAWSSIPYDSRRPGAPGVRLIGASLALGACPESHFCDDGHRTNMVVTEVRQGQLRGYWQTEESVYGPPTVESAGWPKGYFCAIRKARPAGG